MTYCPAEYWPARYREHGDAYVAKGNDPDSYVEQLELVTPLLNEYLPTHGRVLDYGCGPERFRFELESMGLDYAGYDIVPELGTVETIEPGLYDCAVAIYVLQHITDLGEYRAALSDLWFGLRPRGLLFVVDANRADGMAEHMNPRGPEGIQRVFNAESDFRELDADHWVGVFAR